jgi:hypothetical protein
MPLGGASVQSVNPFDPNLAGMGNGAGPFGQQAGFAGQGLGGFDPASGFAFGAPGTAMGDPGATYGSQSPFGPLAPATGNSFMPSDGFSGLMGGPSLSASPFNQQAGPFAGPAAANPFAPAGGEGSQFDQPFNNNPFMTQSPAPGAGGPGSGASPFAISGAQNPFAAGASGAMAVAEMLPFGGPARNGQPSPLGFGQDGRWNGPASEPGTVPNLVGGPFSLGGATGPTMQAPARGDARSIADAWTPPVSDETQPPLHTAGMPGAGSPPRAKPDWQASSPSRPLTDDTEVAFPAYDTADAQPKRGQAPRHAPLDETAPVEVALPVFGDSLSGEEKALGAVLVDGALLSPRKLEVLKGIQQMLSSVDMQFRLGELALQFKFLSPDQLLAALLVSRGVVTPEQIAGLGRIKQELGGSGMDYDLETLLVMFHVLPAEDLRALRKELM